MINIKFIKPKKRYFIVTFKGLDCDGSNDAVIGQATLSASAPFISEAASKEFIRKNFNVKSCVITEVIKLSKKEFNAWIS